MTNHMQSEKGMTLVEILVALFITGVLTTAMFRVYINQHHAWMIQDSVIEMQQNARAAVDELTRQCRMAGYQLPNNLPAIEAYDTNPDTIIIVYQSASCSAPINKTMPQPSAELDCTGPASDVSCFYVGQEAYIFDPTLQNGEFFPISHVQVTPGKIQHNKKKLSRCYPKGSIILAIDRVKYYIDKSDTLHPKLMVQLGSFPPQVYSEDITDLQFTYTLKGGQIVSQPVALMRKDIREVGITLTARTQQKDIEFADSPYRFETYQSKVYLRNLGT